MTVWTVLANGPSLSKVSPDDLDGGGPVVAVNTAIFTRDRLPIDFWSVGDPPRKMAQVWEPLDLPLRARLPVVWCREKQAPNWHKFGIRAWPHPELEAEFRRFAIPRVRQRTMMMNLTITATVTRCIAHGAKKILLFGVDMTGHGYSYGTDALQRAGSLWDKRWKSERTTFELAAAEWADAGVEVVRRRPRCTSPT